MFRKTVREPIPLDELSLRPQTVSRRERRRKRERFHQTLATWLLGALTIGVALVITDTVRLPSSESKPALANVRRTTPTTTVVPPNATTKAALRAPTAAAPLKLWIGGDSLSWSPGVTLGRMTQDTGIVRSYLNSRTSTGLTSPDLYNWPRHAAEDLASFNPEAIIFTIGANDSPVVQPNPKDAGGRPAWEATWRQHVTTMMDLFLASRSDRHVYWVGTPNMRDPKFAAKVLQLNKITREEADRRPNVTYIDAYALFSDSDGRYAAALPDPDGRRRTVRAGDGIHFTDAGGSRLAAEIFRVLDADWNISERAVPDSLRIPQIVSRGSGTQPGNAARSTTSTAGVDQDPNATTPPSTSSTTSGTTPPSSTETTADTSDPPTSSTTAPPPTSTTTAPATTTTTT